jgi:hypothetical protein
VYDFYTGTIHRDVRTSTLQADHVVALADAWRSGAWAWSPARRTAFANDTGNLAMTTPEINGCSSTGKCDLGPDEWSPLSPARACAYVRLYERIKHAWGLKISASQHRAIHNTKAATC